MDTGHYAYVDEESPEEEAAQNYSPSKGRESQQSLLTQTKYYKNLKIIPKH